MRAVSFGPAVGQENEFIIIVVAIQEVHQLNRSHYQLHSDAASLTVRLANGSSF